MGRVRLKVVIIQVAIGATIALAIGVAIMAVVLAVQPAIEKPAFHPLAVAMRPAGWLEQ